MKVVGWNQQQVISQDVTIYGDYFFFFFFLKVYMEITSKDRFQEGQFNLLIDITCDLIWIINNKQSEINKNVL